MDIIWKIKRILDYIPILWNDHEWDYEGFYRLLEKRLEKTEWFFRTHAISVSAERQADRMKYARLLCERLAEDDYLERALIPWHRKWGELGDIILEDVPDQPFAEYKGFEIENAETEEEREVARNEFRLAGDRADRQKERDRVELFEYLTKWIPYWWD